MFKKSKNLVLVALLIVLLAIYFIVRFMDSGERSFKDMVVSLDPAEVSSIVIRDVKNGTETSMAYNGVYWKVVEGNRTYPADSNAVKSLLTQLSSLPTKRYAGKGENVWTKYELQDSVALKVSLLKEQTALVDLYIGKFSYNMPENQNQQMTGRQPQGDATTYVRVAGEKEVYAVDGFLRMSFGRDAAAFRDKTLTMLNRLDINKVVIQSPDSKLTVFNNEGQWLVNGVPADSASTAKYISAISRLSSPRFVNEDFSASAATYRAEISGNNFLPVTIKAFPVTDTNINFVLNSTLNPESYFNGKENGLFEKIFIPEEELLAGSE